jgi:ABC-type uncharacterized transport system auxiliary subunit
MKPATLLRLSLILMFPGIMMMTGCMSEKTVVLKYYVLEKPGQDPAGDPEPRKQIHAVCEIGPTEVNPVLETNQIINRSNSHEFTYYRYHQWAIRPSIAVREMVKHQLESSGLFERVSGSHTRSIPDYRFITSLQKLEVLESNESFAAHVKLEYSILDNANNKVLLNHMADRTEELGSRDLNLFVKEVSQIINDELKVFLNEIGEHRSMFEEGHTKEPPS